MLLTILISGARGHFAYFSASFIDHLNFHFFQILGVHDHVDFFNLSVSNGECNCYNRLCDQRLFGAITPKDDATYKLENIPAGNYAITDKGTRDAAALLTISLRDGEHKTLDITADQATIATKPVGFTVIDVFTPDGVPIPGCEFHFDNAANAPELSSSQDGHMCFRGAPGTYAVTIACPGMNPLHSKMGLNPVGKDGRPLGEFQQRVQLEPITR